jgi:DNA polymerase lambda
MGFRTISMLLRSAPLTHAQRLGAYYYEDLKKKIPRAEIDTYRDTLRTIFAEYDPTVMWQIVGSYRRGEPESGDIDVLIQLKPGLDLRRVVELLKRAEIVVGDLGLGSTKYMGLTKIDEDPVRRLDLLVIPRESWPFAQLYFTGSVKYNTLMRAHANELGLTLNEYRLMNIETRETYPAETEEEVSKLLGLQYLSPEERTRDLAEIPLI